MSPDYITDCHFFVTYPIDFPPKIATWLGWHPKLMIGFRVVNQPSVYLCHYFHEFEIPRVQG